MTDLRQGNFNGAVVRPCSKLKEHDLLLLVHSDSEIIKTIVRVKIVSPLPR
jgi:hypothetical protein